MEFILEVGRMNEMYCDFVFFIMSILFDENYSFVESMRIIINFVNLVRGENC